MNQRYLVRKLNEVDTDHDWNYVVIDTEQPIMAQGEPWVFEGEQQFMAVCAAEKDGAEMIAEALNATASRQGPFDVTFMGAGVWAGIPDELPAHLAGKKVWVVEACE